MIPIDLEWEMTLYYDRESNIMTDEDGNPCFDIFRIISPNSYQLFRSKKKDMLVPGVNGKMIGLIYP